MEESRRLGTVEPVAPALVPGPQLAYPVAPVGAGEVGEILWGNGMRGKLETLGYRVPA